MVHYADRDIGMPVNIHAKTISDAWFQVLYTLPEYCYIQAIQRGSFENEQLRRQLPGLSVFIAYPYKDMIPQIPRGLNISPPTTMDYVEEYFAEYLMNPELSENETYRYSSRICKKVEEGKTQLEAVIDMLKETPYTNQAVIEVGESEDMITCRGVDGKLDPPCLRVVSFKVLPGGILTLSCFFRSWDLWAGFPTNLGGLELLKQFVASEANLHNGPMYAYSDGAHIYQYQEELVKLRTHKEGIWV